MKRRGLCARPCQRTIAPDKVRCHRACTDCDVGETRRRSDFRGWEGGFPTTGCANYNTFIGQQVRCVAISTDSNVLPMRYTREGGGEGGGLSFKWGRNGERMHCCAIANCMWRGHQSPCFLQAEAFAASLCRHSKIDQPFGGEQCLIHKRVNITYSQRLN